MWIKLLEPDTLSWIGFLLLSDTFLSYGLVSRTDTFYLVGFVDIRSDTLSEYWIL